MWGRGGFAGSSPALVAHVTTRQNVAGQRDTAVHPYRLRAARLRALAYGIALEATIMAARALDELALAAGAPSKVLALARAAAPAQAHQRGSQNQPNDDIPPVRLPAGMASWEGRAFTGWAGPVEQAIRDRGISDPVILLRAAAIDNAAWHLITRAGNAASVPSPSDTPESQRHAMGTPARLAAQSFLRDKVARPLGQHPSRSAGQTPRSPSIRVTGRAR
jgi:hypothetical protein